MNFRDLFKRNHQPRPSDEALQAHHEVTTELRPRAEAVARERHRLFQENNFSARIQAIYQGET